MVVLSAIVVGDEDGAKGRGALHHLHFFSLCRFVRPCSLVTSDYVCDFPLAHHAAAIAAGKVAMLESPELTPASAELLAKLMPKYPETTNASVDWFGNVGNE